MAATAVGSTASSDPSARRSRRRPCHTSRSEIARSGSLQRTAAYAAESAQSTTVKSCETRASKIDRVAVAPPRCAVIAVVYAARAAGQSPAPLRKSPSASAHFEISSASKPSTATCNAVLEDRRQRASPADSCSSAFWSRHADAGESPATPDRRLLPRSPTPRRTGRAHAQATPFEHRCPPRGRRGRRGDSPGSTPRSTCPRSGRGTGGRRRGLAHEAAELDEGRRNPSRVRWRGRRRSLPRAPSLRK